MNDKTKTVKTNIGSIPVEDFLDICAMQHGFSDYNDLREQGYYIELPESCLTIKNRVNKI